MLRLESAGFGANVSLRHYRTTTHLGTIVSLASVWGTVALADPAANEAHVVFAR